MHKKRKNSKNLLNKKKILRKRTNRKKILRKRTNKKSKKQYAGSATAPATATAKRKKRPNLKVVIPTTNSKIAELKGFLKSTTKQHVKIIFDNLKRKGEAIISCEYDIIDLAKNIILHYSDSGDSEEHLDDTYVENFIISKFNKNSIHFDLVSIIKRQKPDLRELVKIKKIKHGNGTETNFGENGIYFYKSSGSSRPDDNIGGIYFPCNDDFLFQLSDYNSIRNTKLEDKYLNEPELQIIDDAENITLYKRFINKNNALISHFLTTKFSPNLFN